MNYEIVKPKGAPSWFTPGIKCRVWDNPQSGCNSTIVWYSFEDEYPFIDSNGNLWRNAEPIEVWIPKVGEPVAVWNTTDNYYKVYPFNTDTIGKYITTCGYFCNIAKYDGQRDMRVEVLKDAPRYKR